MASRCVDFHSITDSPNHNKKALEERFFTDIGTNFSKLIRSHNLKVNIFYCSIPNVYTVMISGYNDKTLIDLARKYNFPRGLPVIWVPGVSIKMFGFFPKFDNDDRAEITDTKEFEDITSLTAFEKWSGFLIQFITFEHPETHEICWTATSKNSANSNSIFIQDAKRLFAPQVTPELLSTLNTRGLHICAEGISFQDQTHGAVVIKEAAVVTAIGQGRTFLLSAGREIVVPKTFVDFFSPLDMIEFCVANKLSCGSAYIAENPKDCKDFLSALSERRDFLTASSFQEIIQQNKIKVLPGTVNHGDLLGECLEGLVVRSTRNDQVKVFKFKFANYVVRTMCLRTEFPPSTPAGEPAAPFMINATHPDKIEGFISHWCVSNAGREYWRNWCMLAFVIRAGKWPKHNLVADHIIVAEFTKEQFDPKIDYSGEFKHLLKMTNSGTVVVAVGPVGSGKTTVAQIVCDKCPNSVHIDGDLLGLTSGQVLALGQERNDYTIFQVIRTLMEGKIPVLSTGGGVLFDYKGNFVLMDRIFKALGINVELIVYTPEGDLPAVYADTARVKQCVIERVQRKEWKLPEKYKTVDAFANFIAGLSSKNLKFAETLVTNASQHRTYPVITASNRDQVISDLKAKPFEISAAHCECSTGRFNQIRLLMEVKTKTETFRQIGHITWIFDTNGVQWSLEDFKKLREKYPEGTVSGQIITGLSSGSKQKNSEIRFTIPDTPIHDDKSTHVTLDPGSHAPVCMKTAAFELAQGKKSVTLPEKNGKDTKTYTSFKREACEMVVLGAFGI